jgi:uncharacterized protein (DUF488 family)
MTDNRCNVVCTLGYQGSTLSEFIAMLKSADVSRVVDVRRFASSRMKGFAKTALATALAENGIEYSHMRELGMPAELLKNRSEQNGNRDILDQYRASMEERNFEVRQLSAMASRERICLVCFEADYRHCHRSVVADSLRRRHFSIHHLSKNVADGRGG